MTNQPTVVVGGTVSGNVGSCSIVETDVRVDWIHIRSMGVNSCTGGVVADYTYLDGFGGTILAVLGTFGIIFALTVAIVAGLSMTGRLD